MQEKKRFIFGVCAMLLLGLVGTSSGKDDHDREPSRGQRQGPPPTEAPTGFDNQTNGLTTQEEFNTDREDFEETETVADGLGPVYNARSCAECHATPITGSTSQISVLRAGHWDGRRFTDAPGGSLIHDRAIDAAIQEFVMDGYNVRAFRMTTNVLGAGFIEAIATQTLEHIARDQRSQSHGRIAGQLINVPVLESGDARRAGRFGAKNQHASLMSFAADAYFNEMGITNPFFPTENTSLGRDVAAFDTVPDPEDDGHGVEMLARYMRATKAPSRHDALAASSEAQVGERLFQEVGCGVCHVSTIVTARPGTVINGGAFTVPEALGNKLSIRIVISCCITLVLAMVLCKMAAQTRVTRCVRYPSGAYAPECGLCTMDSP